MTRSPLDVLRATAEAHTPLGPVHGVMATELCAIEPGRCTGAMPVGDGGVETVLVLADFVVGLCVTSTLGPGERITTLRLAVEMLGPIPARGTLHARGELEHGGGPGGAGTGVSSALVTDDDGRPVARCSGRNALLADAAGDTFGDDPIAWAPRPRSWSELVTVSDAGPVGLVARPEPGSANTAGVVQGGILAGVAARGLAAALREGPAGDDTGTVDDLTTTFLRAVPADGSPVTCTVAVEHAGRRLRSGRAELRDARDRLVLTATGLVYAG